MSSKRGRKRNDNLPPNRARDVQRAFRARRAAHLEALEQRVQELEDENNTLRAALNLPPASRPALGKGPTGKDKPKSYTPRMSSAMSTDSVASSSSLPSTSALSSTPTLSGVPSARTADSSSSASTRDHSHSPTGISAGITPPSAPAVSMETTPWDEGIFSRREAPESQPSQAYPVTPVSAPHSQTPYSFSPSAPQPNAIRSPIAQMYSHPMPPPQQNYPQNAERPMGDGYADHPLFDRRFSFPQSTFSSSHDTPPQHSQMHAQSPTTAMPPVPPQRGNANIQAPISYAQRRSMTEPQTMRTVLLNQLPSLQHSGHVTRNSSPPGMSDGMGHLRPEFNLQSRVGQMPSLPS